MLLKIEWIEMFTKALYFTAPLRRSLGKGDSQIGIRALDFAATCT
jgi:hypothetical protein